MLWHFTGFRYISPVFLLFLGNFDRLGLSFRVMQQNDSPKRRSITTGPRNQRSPYSYPSPSASSSQLDPSSLNVGTHIDQVQALYCLEPRIRPEGRLRDSLHSGSARIFAPPCLGTQYISQDSLGRFQPANMVDAHRNDHSATNTDQHLNWQAVDSIPPQAIYASSPNSAIATELSVSP